VIVKPFRSFVGVLLAFFAPRRIAFFSCFRVVHLDLQKVDYKDSYQAGEHYSPICPAMRQVAHGCEGFAGHAGER